MNHTRISNILTVLFAVVLCYGPVGLAEPVGSTFTYQGRLIDNNQPADGLYDLQFKLYDAASSGNQLNEVNIPETQVDDGYFTVDVNFGVAFDGNERWLDIGVRPGELEDPNVYTVLSPRQEITPTPYALYALNGGGAGNSPWQVSGSNIYYNNGNVGIGETNPSNKLVVGQGGDIVLKAKAADEDAGDIIFATSTGTQKGRMWGDPTVGQNMLCLSSADNTADITIDPSGNVGIGTSSPAAKLSVNGDISTISNYKIGGNTVLSVPGTNTFVGVGAGAVNTGNYNTFSGYRSGYFNTTGYSNTFSGYAAGYFNTTGHENTFLGLYAGYSNTTGNANTFTGYCAGQYNAGGYNNTFTGHQAGHSNTTGNYNTFSGNNAGYSKAI